MNKPGYFFVTVEPKSLAGFILNPIVIAYACIIASPPFRGYSFWSLAFCDMMEDSSPAKQYWWPVSAFGDSVDLFRRAKETKRAGRVGMALFRLHKVFFTNHNEPCSTFRDMAFPELSIPYVTATEPVG
jgi:hypothetical protein